MGIGEVVLPPLYERPPRPLAMARWLATTFLWWQNGLWIVVGAAAWLWLTPPLDRFASPAAWAVVLVYLRNVVLMVVIVGGLHWWLYVRRSQGTQHKYDERWLSVGRRPFLFRNQTRDNVFWSLASACAVAALYESSMLWLYANDLLPTVPVRGSLGTLAYAAALTLAMFPLVSVHFYANHRLLHTPRLYRWAHSLHHRNVNIGPWSGVSMHPLEHLLYLSAPLMFLLIPANPYLVTLTLTYLLLSPAPSHSGFDRYLVAGGRTVAGGDRFHTLHHRYFDCNYGTTLVPMDKWFGTWHDGSDEARAAFTDRRRRLAARNAGRRRADRSARQT
ncbi:sterol desaturase family protein [Candidatus Poriferisodalis sp.]|uniref:sterol desaturase family protein n=1 Tax=Candidatus Poriferisodalis sp. TaxID=3101277 RepID=UPI003B011239